MKNGLSGRGYSIITSPFSCLFHVIPLDLSGLQESDSVRVAVEIRFVVCAFVLNNFESFIAGIEIIMGDRTFGGSNTSKNPVIIWYHPDF